MGVMHAASEDTTLVDYNIPKGTMLIPNIWVFIMIRWPEPSKFDPARFLDDKNGQVVETDSVIPLSAGMSNITDLSVSRFTQVDKFQASDIE